MNPNFQPQPTTVHNVELIHGYFSSGDEEMAYPQITNQNKRSNSYMHQMRQGGFSSAQMGGRNNFGGYYGPKGQFFND